MMGVGGASQIGAPASALVFGASIEKIKITACLENRHAARNRLCIPLIFLILVRFYPHNGGAMVQRLARSPFKAKIRVRFPLALPTFLTAQKLEARWHSRGTGLC
jgi:hypothetical protein